MYGCESWTIKKAEHWRIDAFELWYWIRLLRVPWTTRRSNQSILKEISPGCSLEGLMLKLKLQSFGHLWPTWCEELAHLKGPWCWGRLRPEGEGDNRGLDGWIASPNQWTCFGWTLGVGEGQGGLAYCGSRGLKESDTTDYWSELNGDNERFLVSFLYLELWSKAGLNWGTPLWTAAVKIQEKPIFLTRKSGKGTFSALPQS